MSRRLQQGNITTHGGWWIVRFREDIQGQENRVLTYLRICPISGPDLLGRTERRRKAAEIIAARGANSERKFIDTTVGVTFQEQARQFMAQAISRRRKPIKPATATTWQNCIDKWLNPNIGNVLLANVTNSTLKDLVAKMHDSRLSAKTIINYAQVVKLVVGSAVDANGEEMFPRKWNSDFIDMPTLGEQKTPTFSEAALAAIVSASTGQQQVVYALLAAGGMRVGEVLGLEIKHLSDDCSTISVKQSAWEGNIQAPKTPAAVRKVDVYSTVARLLKAHVGDRTSGLVFPSRRGTPILQSNFARRDFHPLLKKLELPKTGFHAFRRFRTTWLRKNRAPEDLIRFWLGHADKTVTDGYSKLGEDAAFRKSVAESIGCGFEVPEKPTRRLPSVRSVRKSVDESVLEKAA